MDHARIEALFNGFSSRPRLKVFVQDVSPGSLDGILLSILLGHEPVLEPLFCLISSNPLDSSFSLIVVLLWICLVQLIEVRRQIS